MTSSYIPGLFPPQQPEELTFVVREAASGSDRRNLARLLSRIYRGDRYWSPPSRGHYTRLLSPKHNAFLQGLPIGLFVAEARNGVVGDEIIGGIVVWTGEDTAEEPVAYFGMFETVNNPEVGETLIEAAEFWLMERSPVEAIRGPFSLDVRRAPGLLTDGFNIAPGLFLPYNPPYYPEMIERAGYEPCSETYAFVLPASVGMFAPEYGCTLDAEEEPEAWAQWLKGASGFARAVAETMPGAFGLMLTDDTLQEEPSGLVLIPQAGGMSRGRGLLRRLFRDRSERLLAVPLSEPRTATGLHDLYVAAAHHAHQTGSAEVLCAPIPAEDMPVIRALEMLGADRVQTYRIYEKRF